MLPLSKLFIIHDCMVTGMEEILRLQRKTFAHPTVRRCSSDCCSRLNPAVFVLRRSLSIFPLHLSFVSLHFPFVLCSPCHVHIGSFSGCEGINSSCRLSLQNVWIPRLELRAPALCVSVSRRFQSGDCI